MALMFSDLGYVRLSEKQTQDGLIGRIERHDRKWRLILIGPLDEALITPMVQASTSSWTRDPPAPEPWASLAEARFCDRQSAEIVFRAVYDAVRTRAS